MLRILGVTGLLFLAGCTTTKPVPKFDVTVTPIHLEQAPEWMRTQCPPLPKLPNKELSQAEAEKLWNRDAQIYHECRTKHAAYVRWIEQRDAAISKGLRQ